MRTVCTRKHFIKHILLPQPARTRGEALVFRLNHGTTALAILILTAFFLSSCNLPSLNRQTSQQSSQATQAANLKSAQISSTLPIISSPECVNTQTPLITSLDVFQVPNLPEPISHIPFQDPVFGTCIIRLTDRARDIDPDDKSGGLKNYYSRVQAFNADESLLLIYGLDGTWYLYDAQTLQKIKRLPFDIEPRWSETDADIIYYFEGISLTKYNVRNGEKTTIHDFSEDFPVQTISAVWTRYEGSPSADGRYWGLMAEDEYWLTSAFLIYDLQENKVTAVRDVRDWPVEAREIDSVSISQNGAYFLAYLDLLCERGRPGSDANPCGLMVYDRTLKTGRNLLRAIGHSDLALDVNGRDVLVYGDIDTDTISILDLESEVVTPLWPVDFTHCEGCGMHFSGRGFRLPGWVLISSHDGDPTSYTWMDDQVFAIELVPNGRVVRFAHHHSVVNHNQDHDYWAEPHATTNHSFSRVLFTSNWDHSGTTNVDTYVIELPADWTE